MVEICALASGSNGNCYYIGNNTEAILIDVGISNRMLNARLNSAGLSISKIKAIFISHEHTDHIKGMRIVSNKNNIEGYATRETYSRARFDYRSDKINYFAPGDTIKIGNIKVHSFKKQHDAVDPVSFRVELDEIHVGVFTDLGEACLNTKEHLNFCHAAFLETNYDDELLENGNYPIFLKQRVSSRHGHLSNRQALDLVGQLDHTKLNTLILSHISKDNNTPQKAIDTFAKHQKDIRIIAASRHCETETFEITHNIND